MRFTLSQMLFAIAVASVSAAAFAAHLAKLDSRIAELRRLRNNLRADIAAQAGQYPRVVVPQLCGQALLAELIDGGPLTSVRPIVIQEPESVQRDRTKLADLQAILRTTEARRVSFLVRCGVLSISFAVATIGFVSIQLLCRSRGRAE